MVKYSTGTYVPSLAQKVYTMNIKLLATPQISTHKTQLSDSTTVYVKTVEGENFHSFRSITKVFLSKTSLD